MQKTWLREGTDCTSTVGVRVPPRQTALGEGEITFNIKNENDEITFFSLYLFGVI